MIGNEFERLRRNILINRGDGISPVSYLVKTDGTVIYFESDNTLFSRFCTRTGENVSFTINGQSVTKNTIKEIVFGVSYGNITYISNNFLRNFNSLTSVDLSPFRDATAVGTYFLDSCSSLTSIDFSPLRNVTSVGDYFLRTCSSLTLIDLSPFLNLASVGNYFIHNCVSINSVQIGGVNWSGKTVSSGSNAFTNIPLSTSVILYADTSQLANNFKAKFSRTSRWSVVVN